MAETQEQLEAFDLIVRTICSLADLPSDRILSAEIRPWEILVTVQKRNQDDKPYVDEDGNLAVDVLRFPGHPVDA